MIMLLTLFVGPGGARSSSTVEPSRLNLREERFAIRLSEINSLKELATKLEAEGHRDQAQAVRKLIDPEAPPHGPNRFEPLPEIIPALEDDSNRTGTRQVPSEACAVREETARRYAGLADRAFDAGHLAMADASLREVLRRTPDDPEARRLLGYVPHEGGWATPHAVLRLKNGDTPHPTYGWIPADWVPHLEEGMLPAPSRQGRAALRWVSAEAANAARLRDIPSGWQITTPHFRIQASVPLDEGIDFARRLEAFYDLFTSVAADLIGPERLQLAQLRRSATSTAPPKAANQHQVYYFGTKRQYVDYLAPRLRDPGIKDTLGVYLDDQKISYFFKDEGGQLPVEATLYHEVSHQLLFELAGRSAYQRNIGNFWVFEGLGTYFETVEPQADGSLSYGGRVGPRIAEAIRRQVEESGLIPLERFVTLDRGTFNGVNGGDPYLHYAQAMALTVFLMDSDQGIHRDAFLEYAGDAYRGSFRAGASRDLSSYLAIPFDQLDHALADFLDQPNGPSVELD